VDKSESITELTKALVRIQAALKPAVRDKTNPFLKSRYADLSAVWDVCRSLLQENGLAVVQVCGQAGEGSYLETILSHESGEWISGKYPLKPVRADDPQALGSAVTYARRYSLAAVLGIVTEDDDAEGAMDRQPAANTKQSVRPTPARLSDVPVKNPASREQLNQLDVLKKAGKNLKGKVEGYRWKVAKLSDLSFEQAERLIKDFSSEVAV
jgi:hypothetical protein